MSPALPAATGLSPKWRVRLYVVTVVAVVAAAPFALNQAYRAFLRLDAEWRFVEEVVLQPTPGGKHPLVVRWTTPPKIGLVNATAEDAAFVRRFVATLDEVLGESGLSVQLVAASESNIQVYFAARAMFDRLASNLGAKPHPPATGFYLIWPGERLDIATAVAVVGADSSATERQAATVHQLAHVLGLRGDSGVFPESAVFSEGANRSSATTLAPIDRKLLRLLYTNLSPADGWRDLRTAYRRHW